MPRAALIALSFLVCIALVACGSDSVGRSSSLSQANTPTTEPQSLTAAAVATTTAKVSATTSANIAEFTPTAPSALAYTLDGILATFRDHGLDVDATATAPGGNPPGLVASRGVVSRYGIAVTIFDTHQSALAYVANEQKFVRMNVVLTYRGENALNAQPYIAVLAALR